MAVPTLTNWDWPFQSGRRPLKSHKMKMGRSDFDKLELAHFLKNP